MNKIYKIKYENGDFKIIKANNALEVIKKYDLCNKENLSTQIVELENNQGTYRPL